MRKPSDSLGGKQSFKLWKERKLCIGPYSNVGKWEREKQESEGGKSVRGKWKKRKTQ